MNIGNLFGRFINSPGRVKNNRHGSSNRKTSPLQVESLEPRMMLNGDPGVVLFETGFEDADVEAGQFGFFTSVSGFTATPGAVEIQNTHPAVGPAGEGAIHLELDGDNEISVDIDDVHALSLTLDLQYSPRPGANIRENEIEVVWNGDVISTLSANGVGNSSTDFRSVSIDLPIENGSTAGQLIFRSKFSGSRGLGGLLDDISVTAQLAPPLAIEAIADQTLDLRTTLNLDVDLAPSSGDATDVSYRLLNAPVNSTINSETGEFRFRSSDFNIAVTEDRETETTIGRRQTVVFAGFEDVEVGASGVGFFDSVRGFSPTGETIEVQSGLSGVGPSSQGSQHAELDGQNGIARTFRTIQGDIYELTFDFSARPGANGANNTIEVVWDGEVIRTVTASGLGQQTTDFSSFTVDLSDFSGDRTQLEFRSKNPGRDTDVGGLIDNVRVTRRPVTRVLSDDAYQVVVQATDSNGRTDTETFNILINQNGQDAEPPVNDPPVSQDSTSTVVANYRDDFRATAPSGNWQYLWNAPDGWNGTSSLDGSTGEIGDPSNYVPLLRFGNSYTATGTGATDQAPANFLTLNQFGGHPGSGQLETNGNNTQNRYAIAAWTVDEAGFYAIENSFLTATRSQGQVDVLVHVNQDDPAVRKTVTGNSTDDFDTRLGFLNAGDVIYVAFGPDDSQSFDAFQHDFSIVQLSGADFSVLISDGRTAVSESGGSDSFDIVLHQRPTADVVIELTSSASRDFELSTDTLVFTADNFDVAQTVTITAIDDVRREGLHTATISAEIQQGDSATEFRQTESQLISVTIYDNDVVASLQSQIDQGLKAGLEEIVLTPGVYESETLTPSAPHLSIVGAEDVSIVADGVTLLATSLDSAVRIQNASNLTLEGLTIDYDPLPFTQGTVVGIADDLSYFDVRIHDGYELLPDGSTTRAIVHNATSRLVKNNTFTRFNSSVNLLQGRTVRISNQQSPDALRTGDLISLTRDIDSPHALSIDRSTGVRLEDVTVHASTSFAFYETESSGNEYYNLTVTPGATPEGATEARLLSSNFDSFHSKYASDGPSIVNANFDSSGDDGVAINGDFALVARREGRSLVITTKNSDPHIQVGDTLRFASAESDEVYERTVESIERYEEGDIDFDAVSETYLSQLAIPEGKFDYGFRVTLSQSVPVGVGDLISNSSRNGSGFEVLNSRIHNTRARGLVLKASDGLVAGNTITQAGTAGILVSTEATFFAESGFTDSLVIDNNVIRSVGFTASSPNQNKIGGIVITADYNDLTRGHRNIDITNNELFRVSGINIAVTNAIGVDVFDNQFIEAQPFARTHGSNVGLDSSALVYLDNVSDVRIRRNVVTDLSAHNNHLILQSSSVSNVAVARTGLQTT